MSENMVGMMGGTSLYNAYAKPRVAVSSRFSVLPSVRMPIRLVFR